MPKSSKKGERATSPPPGELEEVDPADDAPEVEPLPKKKKKKTREDVTEAAEAEAPKKKRSKKKHVPTPEEEEQQEEDAAQAEDGETEEIDMAAVGTWVDEFRSENRRLPNVAELAEATGFDDAVAKKVHKKIAAAAAVLVNKKKAKKIRGYTDLATQAGYGFLADEAKDGEALPRVARVDRGVDMLHPLVSMSDTLRLATFAPLTPDAVSINQAEFKDHLELVKTTFAQSVGREITANVDPMFRAIVTAATKAQLAAGGSKINPSTVHAILKPMVDHLAFPSVLAPPGLVKFSKDEAPPARKDFDAGERGLLEWKKEVAAYNKKVKYNDRGIGAVEVDGDDDAEKKLAKKDADDSKANAKLFKTVTEAIEKEKVENKQRRLEALAAKAK